MRNMLLLGASALVLSLSGVGAYAQQARDLRNYSADSSQTSDNDVQRPHGVLRAYVRTDDAPVAYPQHWDARSGQH